MNKNGMHITYGRMCIHTLEYINPNSTDLATVHKPFFSLSPRCLLHDVKYFLFPKPLSKRDLSLGLS